MGQLNPWLPYTKVDANRRFRLFCLPYAGGSASIFRSWPAALGADIEVCPIELPGRGTRYRERAVSNLQSLTQAVCNGIVSHLDKPFFFFGHSMGAMLGFEVLCHLQATTGREPLIFFPAGRQAPHIPDTKITYNLPDSQLMQRLRQLNGTPQELMDRPEFKTVILPTLRADFAICETYRYKEGPPLNCPIVALGGVADWETVIEDLEGWRQHTRSFFKSKLFPGGHFFLNTAKEQMLETMKEEMVAAAARSGQAETPR